MPAPGSARALRALLLEAVRGSDGAVLAACLHGVPGVPLPLPCAAKPPAAPIIVTRIVKQNRIKRAELIYLKLVRGV